MDSVDKRKSASYSMGKEKREAHFVNEQSDFTYRNVKL